MNIQKGRARIAKNVRPYGGKSGEIESVDFANKLVWIFVPGGPAARRFSFHEIDRVSFDSPFELANLVGAA